MKAIDKITKARAGLIMDSPFFGGLALRLRLIEDQAADTMWTDGRSIGYSPAFVDSLSLVETKAVLAHEVMHCAAQHHTRRAGRNGKKWNVAADHAINHILNDARFTLPDGALMDDRFKGMSADQIFALLPDQAGGGQGDQAGNDPGGCGEVRDCPGKDGRPATETEKAIAEQEWKISVNQAAQLAKAAGNMPSSLQRLIDEIMQPKIDWQELLRQFVDQAAKNDFCWQRPNRRYLQSGFFLPSFYSQELGTIAIAIDTSISVSQRELDQYAAEISAILETFNVNITVLCCDTRIAGVEHFSSHDLPIKLDAKGGGGTRFRPVFDWIAENDQAPTCLIYMTDMEASFPDQAPEYPVVWLSTSDIDKAPFGQVIQIEI